MSSADLTVRPPWLIVAHGDQAATAVQDTPGENLIFHKRVKILFPHRMFVIMIWSPTRTHGEQPFRFYEPLFIVQN